MTGKVYKRAIELFWQSESNKGWKYLCTTNAFRTCREAVADAKATFPKFSIKGNFAKKEKA
jgi:hypothetical protein